MKKTITFAVMVGVLALSSGVVGAAETTGHALTASTNPFAKDPMKRYRFGGSSVDRGLETYNVVVEEVDFDSLIS